MKHYTNSISILLLLSHLLLLVSSALSSCLVSRTHAYKYMPNTFVLLSPLQSSSRFSPRFRPVISKLIEPINHSFSSSSSVSPFLSSYQNYSFLSDCSVFRTYKSTQLLSSSLCWKRTIMMKFKWYCYKRTSEIKWFMFLFYHHDNTYLCLYGVQMWRWWWWCASFYSPFTAHCSSHSYYYNYDKMWVLQAFTENMREMRLVLRSKYTVRLAASDY